MATARLALIALSLALACGGKDEPPPGPRAHAPITLDAASQAAIDRFVGTWTHVGGEAEHKAALEAVSAVTAEMNGLIRGVAQSRLEPAARIDASLTIAVDKGIVTITRSDRPQPFSAPANGSEFDMKTAEGDDARASLTLIDQTLVTLVKTEDGGGERTYALDDKGQITITARTFSPRLPKDLVYSMHYARP